MQVSSVRALEPESTGLNTQSGLNSHPQTTAGQPKPHQAPAHLAAWHALGNLGWARHRGWGCAGHLLLVSPDTDGGRGRGGGGEGPGGMLLGLWAATGQWGPQESNSLCWAPAMPLWLVPWRTCCPRGPVPWLSPQPTRSPPHAQQAPGVLSDHTQGRRRGAPGFVG